MLEQIGIFHFFAASFEPAFHRVTDRHLFQVKVSACEGNVIVTERTSRRIGSLHPVQAKQTRNMAIATLLNGWGTRLAAKVALYFACHHGHGADPSVGRFRVSGLPVEILCFDALFFLGRELAVLQMIIEVGMQTLHPTFGIATRHDALRGNVCERQIGKESTGKSHVAFGTLWFLRFS